MDSLKMCASSDAYSVIKFILIIIVPLTAYVQIV